MGSFPLQTVFVEYDTDLPTRTVRLTIQGNPADIGDDMGELDRELVKQLQTGAIQTEGQTVTLSLAAGVPDSQVPEALDDLVETAYWFWLGRRNMHGRTIGAVVLLPAGHTPVAVYHSVDTGNPAAHRHNFRLADGHSLPRHLWDEATNNLLERRVAAQALYQDNRLECLMLVNPAISFVEAFSRLIHALQAFLEQHLDTPDGRPASVYFVLEEGS
jgi:hypothetical protein